GVVGGQQEGGPESPAALGGLAERVPQQMVVRGGHCAPERGATTQETSDLVVDARRAGDAHEVSAGRRPSRSPSCSSCATAQGLSVQGARRASAASSSAVT